MAVKSKLFKKCSPNGRIYVYLGKREFISCDGVIEPICGVAHVVESSQVDGKYLVASLVAVFRHGREEDEVMGVSFSKELVVDRKQVFPEKKGEAAHKPNKLQTRLTKKLGKGAVPFHLEFPQNAPNSVSILGDATDSSTMGVTYEVRLEVAEDSKGSMPTKKQSVAIKIRKVQWMSVSDKQRSPTVRADKGFLGSRGKLELEVTLNREIFCHGQEMPIQLLVKNNSKKSVKSIRVSVLQHVEMTMTGSQHKTKICHLETKDGCPINCGSTLDRTFAIKPLAQLCTSERGLALDTSLSKVRDETNFASSSVADSGDSNDLLGVIVSYSIKVKLSLSGMGGEMEVDLPFKLVHPRPDSDEATKLEEIKTQEAKRALNKKRFGGQDSVEQASFDEE